MEKIIDVRAVDDGWLEVTFSGQTKGRFDVRPYMEHGYFSALKDPVYFKQVHIQFRGVGWPEGQDIGPDTIAAELQ